MHPKSENSCLYLLDEPGFYLHASAQKGLCATLQELSQEHFIIYSTHSQYLLAESFLHHTMIAYREQDPENNPKNTGNNIKLSHYSAYKQRNIKIVPTHSNPYAMLCNLPLHY